MKNCRSFVAACVLTLVPPSLLAQGSLTPPGPPAQTMKTLAQIEHRTPISAAGTISQAGSYYLTSNLTSASGATLTISSDNVTLDLNGFTISSSGTSVSPPDSGISIGAVKNIKVHNGRVT